MSKLLDRAAFEARLRQEGKKRYHHNHDFHKRMHDGKLDQAALKRWVANRYYYQSRLPIKDALIVSKSGDAAFRREWTKRIVQQDGASAGTGGLEQWLELAEGVGLERAAVARHDFVLPGVRFACDSYVGLVRDGSLVEAVASSLTELFSPDLMSERAAAWEKHYGFVPKEALAYFRDRPPLARAGADFGLDFVLSHANTVELQAQAEAAVARKCEILWAMLDAIAAG